MPRKQKIPVRPMEDAMPMPLEPRPMSGGSVCVVCKKEIDECCEDKMEGGALQKVVGKAKRGLKKAGMKVDKYVTNTDGLLSDIVNYGIPATTGATLGALGSATGNPAIGIAASALGSKLGTMAADKIAEETIIQSRTGEGLKRKPRFAKGSDDAKKYMAELRAKRGKK